MATFREIKEQADNFRKNKDYENALPLYKDLWDNHSEHCSKWEGWAYAQCLSKLKKYKTSFEYCRKVYEIDKEFNPACALTT